jgi:PAS domain S-box-containing protein
MPKLTWSSALRYACAFLSVAIATAIRQALDPFLGEANPFLFYYFAIAFNVWFGGLGPTYLTIALSGLAVDYFFLTPRGVLGIEGVGNQISLILFVLIGLAINMLAGSLRAALRRTQASGEEARRALEAERSQRIRLRTTLASIADAVITADASGRVTSLNRTAERLTGWSADEAIGRSLREVFRTVDGMTNRTDEMPVAQVLENGAILRSGDSIMLVSRDGRSRPVEQSTAPIQEEGGQITGMVLVFRDVTERCRAEQAVRESEERFRQLAENITSVFWISDPRQGKVLYVSPAYETIWGRPCQSLYDRPDSFLEAVHASDRAKVLEAQQKQTRGQNIALEYRVVRPDGSERWVWDRGFPILDESGQVVRVAGIAEDVTKRKRAEAQLREADRRKDEFLAMLAHELRNPLAPIASALHLMTGQGETDVEDERAMAERQVRHMARLIDDLMDVSRISRGKVVLRKERVDLKVLVNRAAEAGKLQLTERRNKLIVSVSEEPVLLEADPTRLEQVLTNLLNNASKFTDPGGRIWITAEREGDRAVVRVKDSGVGIEPAMLPEVFGLFVQAERRLDRSQGGLGIGLSLVKSLVEMHGGTVTAHSEGPGRGSEFIVRLPALDRSSKVGGGSPCATRPQPSLEMPVRRILVVDDNVDAADSLGRLLSRLWGQEIQVAYDGPSALEVAQSFQPEVVLLDIGLPGMDGCEVARRLRGEPELADVLLIAVTGWGQERDRLQVHNAGFNHHLVKPVDLDALKELLVTRAGRPARHDRCVATPNACKDRVRTASS